LLQTWSRSVAKPKPTPPALDQESVWDYPRPPRLERAGRRIEVWFGGDKIVDSSRAWRVLETSHPPVYYVPSEDVRSDALRAGTGSSMCEWKGRATYFDVASADRIARNAAWTYREPTPAFAPIAGYLAFYPALMDECRVDGVPVAPQPGSFYGGWITPDVVGPFKGEPGSWDW
jgi:uncharacterized protein (DUF427 family)